MQPKSPQECQEKAYNYNCLFRVNLPIQIFEFLEVINVDHVITHAGCAGSLIVWTYMHTLPKLTSEL